MGGHLVGGHQYTSVTAFLHLLIFSPFTSPSFFLPTTTMLTSITSSLRSSFSLATRALATTNVVRQQPNYSEECAEQENGRRRDPFHLHRRAGHVQGVSEEVHAGH